MINSLSFRKRGICHMEKRKNIGAFFDRKSVFFRWFLSYLMMLILALLASMAIYFYAFRVIDKQQKNTNEIMLEKIETYLLSLT